MLPFLNINIGGMHKLSQTLGIIIKPSYLSISFSFLQNSYGFLSRSDD